MNPTDWLSPDPPAITELPKGYADRTPVIVTDLKELPTGFGWTMTVDYTVHLHREPHEYAAIIHGWQHDDILAAGGITYKDPRFGTIIRHKAVREDVSSLKIFGRPAEQAILAFFKGR